MYSKEGNQYTLAHDEGQGWLPGYFSISTFKITSCCEVKVNDLAVQMETSRLVDMSFLRAVVEKESFVSNQRSKEESIFSYYRFLG